MKKEKMYRYSSTSGAIISNIDLKIENQTECYRLFSDWGKILTNGIVRKECVEVLTNELDQWYEVEKTDEEMGSGTQVPQPPISSEDNINYKQLLDIITEGEE